MQTIKTIESLKKTWSGELSTLREISLLNLSARFEGKAGDRLQLIEVPVLLPSCP